MTGPELQESGLAWKPRDQGAKGKDTSLRFPLAAVGHWAVAAPTIAGFRTHHYMYGLAGIAGALLVHSLIVYAISVGMFTDEVAFLVTRGKTHADNYSWLSLAGTAVLIIAVFFFRRWLSSPFLP